MFIFHFLLIPCQRRLYGLDLRDVSLISTANAHIHSFALDSKGKLYGWGCGSDGRLGLKAFFGKNGSKRLMKCYVSTPSMVEKLESENVLSVTCGKYWSFAIVE